MQRWNKEVLAGFLGAVCSLAVFAWLATQVFRQTAIAFDGAVRDAVRAWESPALTAFFRAITEFGSWRTLIPLGAFVVWRLVEAGRRRAAILFVIAAVGGVSLENILKLLFRRGRPEPLFGYALPSSYSFPSGHAMISVCFYGVLAALIAPRLANPTARAALWAGTALGVVLIGVSRIYLNVHHPSDIVAGYAASVFWVLTIREGDRMWRGRARRVRAPS